MERGHYGVRTEIKDTADAFYRAVTNKNIRAIETVWAQVPYAAVAGRSGQLQQGWEGVRQYWAQRFQHSASSTVKVKLTHMICHALGDVGWLSGTEIRTVRDGEQTRDELLRVTCVLERRGTSWQIVSYHASAPCEAPLALASAS